MLWVNINFVEFIKKIVIVIIIFVIGEIIIQE